jgi:hypothetical protein
MTTGDTTWANLLSLMRSELAATPLLLLFDNAENCMRIKVRAGPELYVLALCMSCNSRAVLGDLAAFLVQTSSRRCAAAVINCGSVIANRAAFIPFWRAIVVEL